MTLRVENLTVTRGGMPVLEGLSFTLTPGQVLVLRGPNGIGKTTLLRTVGGLQPPHRGTVHVDSDSITYAAHADGIKPTLTVRENLTFWSGIHGGNEVPAAMRAMNLTDLAERQAQNLSAGQKRRLGLARLLITGRPIWALDEPTVSLDTASVALFADAVRAHVGAGGSALIATHIDLGLDAEVLDVTPFKATLPADPDFDEAFL